MILLRPLNAADIPRLVTALQDAELSLITAGDAPPVSDLQAAAFWQGILANPTPDWRYFGIEPSPGQIGAGELVGACSLQHIDTRNRHAELRIFILATEYRGMGYGTEAVCELLRYGFDVLRLDKVYLGVYDFNEAGLRSYERVGFHYEGRFRHMLHYQGRYHDEWRMRLFRSEWKRDLTPPTEGLRPYHAGDLDSALNLLQQQMNLRDREDARTVLRRLWRQIDRDVHVLQVEGMLVALMTVPADGVPRPARDVVCEPAHQIMLERALASG